MLIIKNQPYKHNTHYNNKAMHTHAQTYSHSQAQTYTSNIPQFNIHTHIMQFKFIIQLNTPYTNFL